MGTLDSDPQVEHMNLGIGYIGGLSIIKTIAYSAQVSSKVVEVSRHNLSP